MFNDKKVSALILAAGKGTRMNSDINKQYLPIGGIAILEHTIEVFEENSHIDEIILIVNKYDIEYAEALESYPDIELPRALELPVVLESYSDTESPKTSDLSKTSDLPETLENFPDVGPLDLEISQSGVAIVSTEILPNVSKISLNVIPEFLANFSPSKTPTNTGISISKYKNNFSKLTKIEAGGKERQESSQIGLELLDKDSDFVLIHDGARPFVTDEILNEMIEALMKYDVCCTCVPVKDTIKIADENGNIEKTPKRSTLYAAQTPQGFKTNIIKSLYNKARMDGFSATDDSQIAEHYGYISHIVKGSYENIKITTEEDLYTAENIFQKRMKS